MSTGLTTDTAPTAGATEADASVEAMLARDTIVFGDFHRGRLLGFAEHLAGTLHQYAERLDVDVTATLDAAVSDLVMELSQLAGRALVDTFHDYRTVIGLPPEPGSTTAFELFSTRLSEPAFADQLERPYPILTRLLDTAVADRLRLLGEVLAAASADREVLEALGLAPYGRLTAIAVSSGDAHNGGRRVAVWRTTAGALVYKPRSLALDGSLASAAELLTPYLEADCALRVPRMLSRTGHGWQEYVSAASMTTVEQVRRHRYRMGAFLALFASLGSTDLHHENVIAAGEHPMFVDLETVLQHLPEPGPDGPVESLASPLLATMLLPMRVAGTALDVDMSGMGTVGAQTSHLLSYSMLDRATDAMRFERASFEVRHGDNLARLGDVALPATTGEEDLVLGFTDALVGIRAERDRLLQEFAHTPLSVRQVVRPTNVYARFLAASTHPRYLSDPAERTRLLSSMATMTTIAGPAREPLAALELSALERHDVPWFDIAVDGVALRAPLDGSTPPAYSRPLAERVRASLDDFLDTPPARHEHTIRMCLATSIVDPPLSPLDARPRPGSYAAEVFAAGVGPVAAGVARLLVDSAHPAGAEQRAWITPSVEGGSPDARGLVFRPGDIAMYEGGGIPLLLAARSRMTGNAGLARLARLAIPQDHALPEPDQPRGLSYYAGLVGSAALAHEVGVLAGDDTMLALRDELLTDLLRTPVTEEHEVDLIGGHSASAAWIAGLVPAAPHLDPTAYLTSAVAGMRRALSTGDLPQGELAHGDLGVAWSLARCADLLGDDAALGQAGEFLSRHVCALESTDDGDPRQDRLSRRAEVAHASWCKGTAGSLIALAEGLPLTGWMPAEVDRVVDLLVERGTRQVAGVGRDLSPCHGVTGWVQALIRTGRLRQRPVLVDLARRTFEERRALVPRIGYTGGLSGSAGFLGYMLGLTGVAHTEVLLDHPDWGSPLTLTATLPATLPVAAPEEDH